MTDILDAIGQPHVQLVLRLVLGALLLIAGVAKLVDREATRQAVADYEVLPARAASAFASALPWIELSLGALLLVGLFTGVAATFAALLFLSFSLAISVNLARGRSFDCHCFGSVQHDEIGATALLRSLILALAALAIAVEPSAFGGLDAFVFGSQGLPPASEVLPAIFIAFVIVDALVLLPELATFRDIFAGRYDTRPEAVRSHVRTPQPISVEASNGHRAHISIDEVGDA